MIEEALRKKVLQLHEVERLSIRQIAKQIRMSRDTVAKIIRTDGVYSSKEKDKLLNPYRGLIAQWYIEYPLMRATQVYERLKSYGCEGSYRSIVSYTKEFRERKRPRYHALTFLPGEEVQVDWFIVTGLPFGRVYGFIFVLSYSRYAWGKIYPRNSFEFFLDGHIRCFEKIGGIPHTCRYDNLKSVIISRNPQIQYNSQFLDFSRFYRFAIYVCNPHSGNEKGRVERIIRDIRSFLRINEFSNVSDMNTQFHAWLDKRNNTIHRATRKTPVELLAEEKLLTIPLIKYEACKIIPVCVSSTGFVEFDTNKYSVPNTASLKNADLFAYPDKIIVKIGAHTLATHKRSFSKNQTIENPLHREGLLNTTSSQYKYHRILQLMKRMDPHITLFLEEARKNGENKKEYAYQLFKLLKHFSKSIVISAITEACSIKAFKLKTIQSLLNLPGDKQSHPVYPKNTSLLNINYKNRKLEDYDKLI